MQNKSLRFDYPRKGSRFELMALGTSHGGRTNDFGWP